MISQQELAEQERVKALHALAILDTPPEDRFDRYTRLAAAAFGVPMALISLVDTDRQWFKSAVGVDVCETPRSMAFCSHTVALDDMLVVPDTHLDERFASNPGVCGAPYVRFYAGQPVRSLDGQPLGTLCIVDTRPRQLDEAGQRMLRDLAQLAQDELNRAMLVQARDAAQDALRELNAGLERRVEERTRELHAQNRALEQEIHQRQAAEQGLRRSEKRIRAIVDSSIAVFISMDEAGRISDWNPAAERLFGWSRAEAIGQLLTPMIVPERFRVAHDAGFARFLATGEGRVLNQRLELPILTRDGSERMVEMAINAFRVDGDLFVGAFMHDISDRLAAEQALRREQELLDAVLESVDVGVIACDAEGRFTLINREAREFHGLDADAVGTVERSVRHDLFQTDGVTPLADGDNPLARVRRSERVKDVPMVIAPAGGRAHRVLASGRALHGADGEGLGAVVVLKDVTELAESRARAVESEERLRTIADNVPALIAYLDTNLRYRFANQRYQEWFGVRCEHMVGKTVEEAMGDVFYAPRRAALERCLAGHGSALEIEEERRGRKRVISATYLPHLRDGVVQGIYVLCTDATSAREYERQLHALAHSDHLTGLPNRRSYEERLAQAIARSKRSATPLALAFLDVDHFKQINDSLGHAGGDAVLREFARRLSGTVRSTDTVARLAGDEFVIVLEQVGSPLECRRIGDKLLEALRAPFQVDGRELAVSGSIGFAWSTRPEQGTLAHAADEALYQSKHAGRNTASVVVVGGGY
jgi:diguanylate cyclase (GGDEF)-like protein/PAS domain S-box-containing protein